ncbi:MAG: HD domain-containing protein [Blastocatellia bacterium]|nr:HD domain-containing protein [Blastocatellia bacterium]
MFERRYRDPVHNLITLDEARSDDKLLADLIDTPEFQRLRRIKQLGLAMFAYQGAEHSRFSHSLGVMHVMTRVLEHIGRERPISPHDFAAARAGALLHDIGHGPFSHVIEKVLGFRHERWTIQILRDSGTALHSILNGVAPNFLKSVIAVIEGHFKPDFISQLVSSQLDCDRFDYLLRDSLMTGAKYGNYDLEWILHALAVDPATERLYVRGRGLFAVEEYLQARYYMFRQVYFHHTLRSAENMLVSILRRAVHLTRLGELRFEAPGSALTKLLRSERLSTAEFLSLDDHDLMFCMKQWQHEPDPVLSDISRRFINRQLFKSIDLQPFGKSQSAELLEQIQQVVAAAGFDPTYYLLDDNAADVPYFGPYAPEKATPKARIFVETGKLSLRKYEITEVSEVVRSLRKYQIHRICFPPEVRSQVLTLAQQAMQVSSGRRRRN